jgi:monoamine oxidase
MVDYTGGNLGARLGARNGSPNAQQVQTDADRFASDLDLILPGCKASAARSGGQYLVHVENWLLHPLTKGAYTNNQPGYFTGLEGLYAQASGNLVFAGEHTDSFYNFQGYMEGGVASGSRAATQVAGMF